MKTLAIILCVLAIPPALATRAIACDRDNATFHIDYGDHSLRCAPRHSVRDARLAITTEDGDVMLFLTDDVVAMQLSDRKLRRVHQNLYDAEDADEDNGLAVAIKAVVLSSVRALVRHSAECPLEDLEQVEYRKGRLILTTLDNEHPFEDVTIDDQIVLAGFSERDARAFVREFDRAKARARADRPFERAR